jgi:hypothetical protein
MPHRFDAHGSGSAIQTAEAALQFLEIVNAGSAVQFIRSQLARLAAGSATSPGSNLKIMGGGASA